MKLCRIKQWKGSALKEFETLAAQNKRIPGVGEYTLKAQERKNLKFSFPKVDRRLVNRNGGYASGGEVGPGSYEAADPNSFSRFKPKGSCYGSFGRQMRAVDSRMWGHSMASDLGKFYQM